MKGLYITKYYDYYFESNGYLYSFQHGFRKGYGTSSAIFGYVQFFSDSYDKMQCSSSIFVDYSKAFDTLEHNILCKNSVMESGCMH